MLVSKRRPERLSYSVTALPIVAYRYYLIFNPVISNTRKTLSHTQAQPWPKKRRVSELKWRPWVEQQVVETGLDVPLSPLSVLIRLVELLTQGLLVSLAIWKHKSLQGPTQFWTETQICRNKQTKAGKSYDTSKKN